MIVAILVAVVLLVILVISLDRYVHGCFDNLTDRLTRIENALGAEDWVELLQGVPGTGAEELQQQGILGRLERIEATLDPMARARQHLKRRLRGLDDELKEDPSWAYAHSQVSKIGELVEKGERPDRKDWESWIGTPFPWA
jgi:hypothetical protein